MFVEANVIYKKRTTTVGTREEEARGSDQEASARERRVEEDLGTPKEPSAAL